MNWFIYAAGLALGFAGLAVSHVAVTIAGLALLMSAAILELNR